MIRLRLVAFEFTEGVFMREWPQAGAEESCRRLSESSQGGGKCFRYGQKRNSPKPVSPAAHAETAHPQSAHRKNKKKPAPRNPKSRLANLRNASGQHHMLLLHAPDRAGAYVGAGPLDSPVDRPVARRCGPAVTTGPGTTGPGPCPDCPSGRHLSASCPGRYLAGRRVGQIATGLSASGPIAVNLIAVAAVP